MDTLLSYDFMILDAIQQLRCPFLDVLMPLVTMLGDHGLVPILTGLVLLCIPKTRKAGLTVLLSLLFCVLICNITLKPLVARIRPYEVNTLVELLVDPLSDFSFPSGHTTACFAAAVTLSYHFRKLEWLFYLLAGLVGFSRLYLYVHFPTDVFAGVLFGLLFGFVSIALVNRFYPILQNKFHKKGS